jgi:hypothetical protein
VTEPNRDLALEVEDAQPAPSSDIPETSFDFGVTDPDAPFGRKPDGTPFKRRGKNRPGYDSAQTKGPSGTRTTRSYSGSLENQLGAFLVTVNAPLMLFASRDALDPVEIQALAKALDQEAQRSPRFKKYLQQALAIQGGTSLLLVIAAIAGRRVVRHNLVEVPAPLGNDGVDAALGGIISMTIAKGPINPNLFVMPKEAADA